MPPLRAVRDPTTGQRHAWAGVWSPPLQAQPGRADCGPLPRDGASTQIEARIHEALACASSLGSMTSHTLAGPAAF